MHSNQNQSTPNLNSKIPFETEKEGYNKRMQ